VAANSRVLRAVIELARRLGSLGRYDEAVATIDTALQAIDGARPGRSPFVDAELELPSLLSEKSTQLWNLGRFEEGVTAQQRAAELGTVGGSDWLNQQLGLANLLVLFGKPDDALALVDGIAITDAPTAYLTTVGWIRTCALAGMGRDAEARAEFAAMTAAEPLAYEGLKAAMLCLDDPEALEAFVLEALQQPETRMQALASLQDFASTPGTALQQQTRSRFHAVAHSPAVVAVAAKYGWQGDWSLSR